MSLARPITQPPSRVSESSLTEGPKIEIKASPLWKRLIDIFGSIFLLIALAPLLVVLAMYIKLASRGPVLFVQERIGAGLKPFQIYKFRTMEVSSSGDMHRNYVASLVNSDAPAKKPEYRYRLIPGGGVLRSLSLDELPQLVNVLFGNMSLVGPRPEVLKLEDYDAWQLRRFEVLPGISGLWQVSGKNRLTFNQMVNLDIQYVDRLTFAMDMKIIFKTFGVVFLRRNY